MMGQTSVRHIADKHVDNAGKAWCGKTLHSFEWAFEDVDHAAIYARNNTGWQTICKRCKAAVVRALEAEG